MQIIFKGKIQINIRICLVWLQQHKIICWAACKNDSREKKIFSSKRWPADNLAQLSEIVTQTGGKILYESRCRILVENVRYILIPWLQWDRLWGVGEVGKTTSLVLSFWQWKPDSQMFNEETSQWSHISEVVSVFKGGVPNFDRCILGKVYFGKIFIMIFNIA